MELTRLQIEKPPNSKTEQLKRTFEVRGNIVERWLKIGADEGLTTDTQIATFLINHYISCHHKAHDPSTCCSLCHRPLTLQCARCHLLSQQNLAEWKDTAGEMLPYRQPSTVSTHFAVTTSDTKDKSQHQVPASDIGREPCSVLCSKSDYDGLKFSSLAHFDQTSLVKSEPHASQSILENMSHSGITEQEAGVSSGEGCQSDKISDNALPVHFKHDQCKFTLGTESAGNVLTVTEENGHSQNDTFVNSSPVPGTEQTVHAVPHKLRKPSATQSGKNLYPCSKCEATFQWKNHLRGHLHKVHGVAGFIPSELCDQVLSAFSKSKRDRKTPKDSNIHLCTECDASFAKACQLKIHMRGHTGEKPFVCAVCGAAFSRTHKLKNHMRSHTGEKPYCCEECGSSFAQAQSLKEHERIHTGERPYVCSECGSAFVQHSTLKTHLKSHSAERPHVCKICGNAYKNFYSLNRHIRHQHEKIPRDPPQYRVRSNSAEKCSICEECGKTFPDSRNLKRHMIIHTEKSFVCKECGTAFYKSDALKVHSRIHSGEKPYMCTVCGRAFVQSSSLTKHMRVHSDERPFVCSAPNCGASFKGRYELIHHERIHTQYKPHVCQFCSAAFIQPNNLRLHMRMHTDERPYVCETCDKAFRRSTQLKKHKLMHSGLKPYICKVCGSAYRKPETLKFHIQKKHCLVEMSAALQQ